MPSVADGACVGPSPTASGTPGHYDAPVGDETAGAASNDVAPRVFVSHATEDKERFVIAFGTELRAVGVDAWVDKWEMVPGDSLVRKIFEEGLENASAVIVVLSRVSITKPWVREELDAAVVKRINTGSKLIPVVLDDLDPKTDVPLAVRHLVLEYVPDPAELSEVIDRVVRSIFGTPSAPPLGRPPRFARESAVRIGRLDTVDSLVLREAGAEAIRDDGTRFETAMFRRTTAEALEISEDDVADSLDVLTGDRLVNLQHRMRGHRAPTFDLTWHGLRTYLRAYEPSWPRWESALIARLAGWPADQGTTRELAIAAATPMIVALMVLEQVKGRGLILSKSSGSPAGPYFVITSAAQLRRLAPT